VGEEPRGTAEVNHDARVRGGGLRGRVPENSGFRIGLERRQEATTSNGTIGTNRGTGGLQVIEAGHS